MELLEIGECDDAGEIVVEGEYFLESIFRKLSLEILEKWKLYSLPYESGLKNIFYPISSFRTTREKLVLEFEEKIRIIKMEHEEEMCRRRGHDRKVYCELIRMAWGAYEKTLMDVEFVKEIRFRYVRRRGWSGGRLLRRLRS
jgi:hypothetical protein